MVTLFWLFQHYCDSPCREVHVLAALQVDHTNDITVQGMWAFSAGVLVSPCVCAWISNLNQYWPCLWHMFLSPMLCDSVCKHAEVLAADGDRMRLQVVNVMDWMVSTGMLTNRTGTGSCTAAWPLPCVTTLVKVATLFSAMCQICTLGLSATVLCIGGSDGRQWSRPCQAVWSPGSNATASQIQIRR
jgi:hypothetical protein